MRNLSKFKHFSKLPSLSYCRQKFNLVKASNFSSKFDKHDYDYKINGPRDKEKIYEEAKQNKNYDFSYSINEQLIRNADPSELISIMTSLTKDERDNYDIWILALERFNNFLCDNKILARELGQFLDVLSFIQKRIIDKRASDINKPDASNGNFSKNPSNKNSNKDSNDILMRFTQYLSSNFKINVLKHLWEDGSKINPDRDEEYEQLLDELFDIYTVLFENISLKVINDLKNPNPSAQYSTRDCIKMIKSFSIGSIGSDMLYLVLLSKVMKDSQTLNLSEIADFLEYFPKDLLKGRSKGVETVNYEESEIETNKVINTQEYKQLFEIFNDTVTKNLPSSSDREFLQIWRGVLNSDRANLNLISTFLSNFDLRINLSEKLKEFYLDFLQSLAYFVKDNSGKFNSLRSLDFELLYSSIYDNFIKRHLHSFNIKEIATIFWVLYNLKILNSEKITLFEGAIKDILLAYINDPKDSSKEGDRGGYGIKAFSASSYQIEPYDVKALQFFINSVPGYKGQLNQILNSAMRCLENENMNAKSRSWF